LDSELKGMKCADWSFTTGKKNNCSLVVN